jgi:hypothetical protein
MEKMGKMVKMGKMDGMDVMVVPERWAHPDRPVQ